MRTFQLASLALVPLCLDILLFDTKEFDLHVATLQEHHNVLPWFSNADMLVTVSIVFFATTLPAVLGGSRREREAPATASES